jgi:hypothetical protein
MGQPNMILPSQHFMPRRKQVPEQQLMIAVVQDAITGRGTATLKLPSKNGSWPANPDVLLIGLARAVARPGGYQR